ncbi:MAG: leucine-rich repeat domain-containing protein [Bacteroidaceae bacterium]|nr:leucine-rich repeat domain-containing protein [Bacteroidaceae bacterium]
MKRSLFFLFALLFSYNVLAHDFVVDGICYNIISEEYKLCEVTFFKNESGAAKSNFYKDIVFVPETVEFGGESYYVSAIGTLAFYLQNELLSVVMPTTIKTIKSEAFSSCKNIKSIIIPTNVKEIESNAFQSLESLTYLAVDEGNEVYDSRKGCNAIIETKSNTLLCGCKTTVIPDGVEVIARDAFWTIAPRGNETFSFDIPGSVKVIKENAFSNCEWLSSVTLHEGLEEIGLWAFNGTSIESIVIPKTVKKIEPSAFCNTKLLKSIKVERGNKVYDSRKGCNAIVESATDCLLQACSTTTIPDGIKIVGKDAFYKINVKSVTIPASVHEIKRGAFFGSGLQGKLVIPGNVKSVGESAFSACYGIDELVVEEGCEAIGASAFSLCSSLRRAELPSSLERFGVGSDYVLVFQGCSLLENVEISEHNPYYISNGDAIIEKSTMTVIAGTGLGHSQLHIGRKEHRPKKIAKGAFWGMLYMTAVWLPETIEEIEESAFYDCPAIEFIVCSSKVPPLLGKNFGVVNAGPWHVPLQERVTLVVPQESLDAYKSAPGWSEFKHIVTN